MLSLAKLAGGPDAGRYYTDAVARGREDYYAGAGEAKGRWAGVGSGLLGLHGEVDEGDFAQLMRGLGPLDGGPLRQSQGAGDTAGFDVTFSAPKSVSVRYGIGDERTITAVREAHDRAVVQALGYLERQTAYTRRGKAGRERVKADGLVVALFRHRTSRAGDPQLHTHAVIANTVRADGRWSALDARGLYREQKTAGYLYKAALRDELSRSLGVSWGPVEKGSAEIAGVPEAVIQHFSRRRQEITDHLAEHGRSSPAAAEMAALETRKRKDYAVPAERLRQEWRARAGEHGLDSQALERVLDRPWHERLPVDLELQARSIGGMSGLTREHASFDRRAVIREWCERHPAGASVARIEQLTDRWLASAHAVQLTEPDNDRLAGALYSTPRMLEAERQLLDDASARKAERAAVADGDAVDRALAARPELTGEQQQMVRALTTSGDGVQVVRAAAGTGKTYALEAARAAWRDSGLRVRGCALSARAARELQEQTAIPAQTIHRLWGEINDRGPEQTDVLVVDEAAMVGTRALHAISRHAREHQIKLVLVGDDKQLPEIQAGGAYTALANRLGAIELTAIKRQHHEWDRQALTALRDGDHYAWAQAYREHDRLITEPTPGRLRGRLVDDWWRAAQAGSDAVMIAHRRSDVADLNDRARQRMRDAGRLGAEEVHAAGHSFALGDRVIARRNNRALDLVNGTRGTVTSVDPRTRRLTLAQHDDTWREIDGLYLDDGHLEHAYAATAHALQGASIDDAFVLGTDDLYQQWGYTALTRHRNSARFYLHAHATTSQPLPGLAPQPDPVEERLAQTLARRCGKTLATTLDRTPQDRHGVSRERAAENSAPVGQPADQDIVHLLASLRALRQGRGRDRPGVDLGR